MENDNRHHRRHSGSHSHHHHRHSHETHGLHRHSETSEHHHRVSVEQDQGPTVQQETRHVENHSVVRRSLGSDGRKSIDPGAPAPIRRSFRSRAEEIEYNAPPGTIYQTEERRRRRSSAPEYSDIRRSLFDDDYYPRRNSLGENYQRRTLESHGGTELPPPQLTFPRPEPIPEEGNEVGDEGMLSSDRHEHRPSIEQGTEHIENHTVVRRSYDIDGQFEDHTIVRRSYGSDGLIEDHTIVRRTYGSNGRRSNDAGSPSPIQRRLGSGAEELEMIDAPPGTIYQTEERRRRHSSAPEYNDIRRGLFDEDYFPRNSARRNSFGEDYPRRTLGSREGTELPPPQPMQPRVAELSPEVGGERMLSSEKNEQQPSIEQEIRHIEDHKVVRLSYGNEGRKSYDGGPYQNRIPTTANEHKEELLSIKNTNDQNGPPLNLNDSSDAYKKKRTTEPDDHNDKYQKDESMEPNDKYQKGRLKERNDAYQKERIVDSNDTYQKQNVMVAQDSSDTYKKGEATKLNDKNENDRPLDNKKGETVEPNDTYKEKERAMVAQDPRNISRQGTSLDDTNKKVISTEPNDPNDANQKENAMVVKDPSDTTQKGSSLYPSDHLVAKSSSYKYQKIPPPDLSDHNYTYHKESTTVSNDPSDTYQTKSHLNQRDPNDPKSRQGYPATSRGLGLDDDEIAANPRYKEDDRGRGGYPTKAEKRRNMDGLSDEEDSSKIVLSVNPPGKAGAGRGRDNSHDRNGRDEDAEVLYQSNNRINDGGGRGQHPQRNNPPGNEYDDDYNRDVPNQRRRNRTDDDDRDGRLERGRKERNNDDEEYDGNRDKRRIMRGEYNDDDYGGGNQDEKLERRKNPVPIVLEVHPGVLQQIDHRPVSRNRDNGSNNDRTGENDNRGPPAGRGRSGRPHNDDNLYRDRDGRNDYNDERNRGGSKGRDNRPYDNADSGGPRGRTGRSNPNRGVDEEDPEKRTHGQKGPIMVQVHPRFYDRVNREQDRNYNDESNSEDELTRNRTKYAMVPASQVIKDDSPRGNKMGRNNPPSRKYDDDYNRGATGHYHDDPNQRRRNKTGNDDGRHDRLERGKNAMPIVLEVHPGILQQINYPSGRGRSRSPNKGAVDYEDDERDRNRNGSKGRDSSRGGGSRGHDYRSDDDSNRKKMVVVVSPRYDDDLDPRERNNRNRDDDFRSRGHGGGAPNDRRRGPVKGAVPEEDDPSRLVLVVNPMFAGGNRNDSNDRNRAGVYRTENANRNRGAGRCDDRYPYGNRDDNDNPNRRRNKPMLYGGRDRDRDSSDEDGNCCKKKGPIMIQVHPRFYDRVNREQGKHYNDDSNSEDEPLTRDPTKYMVVPVSQVIKDDRRPYNDKYYDDEDDSPCRSRHRVLPPPSESKVESRTESPTNQEHCFENLDPNLCPYCGIGVFVKKTSVTGYLTAILCFPCGMYCCLTRKCCYIVECTYCHATTDKDPKKMNKKQKQSKETKDSNSKGSIKSKSSDVGRNDKNNNRNKNKDKNR